VVDLVKEDELLMSAMININEEEPRPMIYLEDIAEAAWISFLRRRPGTGYSFYTGGDDD
jgi:hypothetical protein